MVGCADGWMETVKISKVSSGQKMAPKASFGLKTGALDRKLREESENELKQLYNKHISILEQLKF